MASWVKSGWGTAESSLSCSCNQSASRAAFSSGGLTGEESTLNLICFRVGRRTSVHLVSWNKVLYNVTIKIVRLFVIKEPIQKTGTPLLLPYSIGCKHIFY